MTLGGSGDDVVDPLTAVTGDAEAAALLRRNLTELAAQHRGTATGQLLDDVLAGRRPPSDLQADAGFMEITRSGVQQFRDHLAGLTPEQRRALEEEGAQFADRSAEHPAG